MAESWTLTLGAKARQGYFEDEGQPAKQDGWRGCGSQQKFGSLPADLVSMLENVYRCCHSLVI